MATRQSPDWTQNIDTEPLCLAFQSIKETVEQSRAWASKSLRHCSGIRRIADGFVEQSSKYWSGPNAEEFRRLAPRYLDGPLATYPRRARRSLPTGIYTGLFTTAHSFFSQLATEIEDSDYERLLPSLCRQLEDAKSKLATVSTSSFGPTLAGNAEARRMRQLQIEMLESRIRQVAAELSIAWDCCDIWISSILTKLEGFRDDFNRIGPYLIAHSDASLPVSRASIESLVSSGLKFNDFAAGVKTQISRAQFEIPIDHPLFNMFEQAILENPSLWGEKAINTLNGSIVMKGAAGSLTVLLAAFDLGMNGYKLETEADILCASLKLILGFPSGVFEKYFEPLIRKQFRSTLFSKGLFKAFQVGITFLGPAGLAAALMLEVVNQQLLTNVLDSALDDSIDQVLNQGLSNWSSDEESGEWVYPVQGIRRSLTG